MGYRKRLVFADPGTDGPSASIALLAQVVSERRQLLSEFEWVEHPIESGEPSDGMRFELVGSQEPLKRSGGHIVALDHLRSLAFLGGKLANWLEEVHVQPLLLVELLHQRERGLRAVSAVADGLPNRGPVPLLHKGLVILAVGSAPGKSETLLLAVPNEHLVDELRAIVGVELAELHGHEQSDAMDGPAHPRHGLGPDGPALGPARQHVDDRQGVQKVATGVLSAMLHEIGLD